MVTRRRFIAGTSAGLAGLAIVNPLLGMLPGEEVYLSNRPPVGKRNFESKAVEDLILKVKADIGDPELAWLFENCFPNTLDTTIFHKISGERLTPS